MLGLVAIGLIMAAVIAMFEDVFSNNHTTPAETRLQIAQCTADRSCTPTAGSAQTSTGTRRRLHVPAVQAEEVEQFKKVEIPKEWETVAKAEWIAHKKAEELKEPVKVDFYGRRK